MAPSSFMSGLNDTNSTCVINTPVGGKVCLGTGRLCQGGRYISGYYPYVTCQYDVNFSAYVVLLLLILTVIFFDAVKTSLERRVPKDYRPVLQAFFAELASLGFVSLVAFIIKRSWDDDDSIINRIGYDLNLGLTLYNNIEYLHFLLFGVTVAFIFMSLVLLRYTMLHFRQYEQWGDQLEEGMEDNHQMPRIGHYAVSSKYSLMPRSLTEEREIFLRLFERFTDKSQVLPGDFHLPPAFNLGKYFMLRSSEFVSEILSIEPMDWLIVLFLSLWPFLAYVETAGKDPENTADAGMFVFWVYDIVFLLVTILTDYKLHSIAMSIVPIELDMGGCVRDASSALRSPGGALREGSGVQRGSSESPAAGMPSPGGYVQNGASAGTKLGQSVSVPDAGLGLGSGEDGGASPMGEVQKRRTGSLCEPASLHDGAHVVDAVSDQDKGVSDEGASWQSPEDVNVELSGDEGLGVSEDAGQSVIGCREPQGSGGSGGGEEGEGEGEIEISVPPVASAMARIASSSSLRDATEEAAEAKVEGGPVAMPVEVESSTVDLDTQEHRVDIAVVGQGFGHAVAGSEFGSPIRQVDHDIHSDLSPGGAVKDSAGVQGALARGIQHLMGEGEVGHQGGGGGGHSPRSRFRERGRAISFDVERPRQRSVESDGEEFVVAKFVPKYVKSHPDLIARSKLTKYLCGDVINAHQSLFWMQAHGIEFMTAVIRMIVASSVVLLTVAVEAYRDRMLCIGSTFHPNCGHSTAGGVIVLLLSLVPPITAFLFLPRMIRNFVIVSNVELMKCRTDVLQVMTDARNRKTRKTCDTLVSLGTLIDRLKGLSEFAKAKGAGGDTKDFARTSNEFVRKSLEFVSRKSADMDMREQGRGGVMRTSGENKRTRRSSDKRLETAASTVGSTVRRSLDVARSRTMRGTSMDGAEQSAISMDHLQKVVVAMDPSTVANLRELFDEVDTHHSGALDRSSLGKLLEATGTVLDDEGVGFLFDLMDLRRDGKVTFLEFAAVFYQETSKKLDPLELADKVWDLLDTKKAGFVTLESVESTLHRVRPTYDCTDILRLVRRIDYENTGRVARDHFHQYVVNVFKDQLESS